MNLLIRQFIHSIRLKMEKFMNRNAILLSIGKEDVQVAGISCGLIQDGDDFTTFIDIQGVEDFHGEMDFKVAGTKQASPPSRWTSRTTA